MISLRTYRLVLYLILIAMFVISFGVQDRTTMKISWAIAVACFVVVAVVLRKRLSEEDRAQLAGTWNLRGRNLILLFIIIGLFIAFGYWLFSL